MSQRVIFKNQQGKRLVGLIDQPKGKPPYPAVIICHGFKGYKEQKHLSALAGELAKNGILAFRFDFGNGIGKSYGQMSDIKFGQYLSDLKTAVNFLSRQKIVEKNSIGLAGHSLGGQLIMHYAPADKRIKVLADLAGVISRKSDFDRMYKYKEAEKIGYFIAYSRSKKLSFKIKFEYLKDLLSYNTVSKIKKIKIPVIIVHGTKDDSVPIDHLRIAYKLLKQPKKLAIINGAPHTWKQPRYYKKINPIVVDWFKKYLSQSEEIIKAENFLAKSFKDNPSYSFNDWKIMYNHSRLVRDLSLKIAQNIDCDRTVLNIGALLHDIGKTYKATQDFLRKKHGILGYLVSKNFLNTLALSKEQKTKLIKILSGQEQIVEAKIIKDADIVAFFIDQQL